jgi:hypothetical protein
MQTTNAHQKRISTAKFLQAAYLWTYNLPNDSSFTKAYRLSRLLLLFMNHRDLKNNSHKIPNNYVHDHLLS